MQQANVLAKVAYAFESDMDASDLEDDRETIFSSVDLLSPAGQTDAQTLALMLQEQLDAINNEIRYPSGKGGGVWTSPGVRKRCIFLDCVLDGLRSDSG